MSIKHGGQTGNVDDLKKEIKMVKFVNLKLVLKCSYNKLLALLQL